MKSAASIVILLAFSVLGCAIQPGFAPFRNAFDAQASSWVPGPIATPTPIPTTAQLPGGPAKLTFSDEFLTGIPAMDAWNRDYDHNAAIGGELQSYVADAFVAASGYTRIRADERQVNGFDFTSGAATTSGTFDQTYGYFEIRARIPKGIGLRSVFTMRPVTDETTPEVVVMDVLGRTPSEVAMSFHHTDMAGQKRTDSSSFAGTDLSQAFHRYAIDWRPGLLVWYVDGIERKRVTGPEVPSQPMAMFLRLAVGGSGLQAPDSNTVFPSHLDVDYVRAYQYEP